MNSVDICSIYVPIAVLILTREAADDLEMERALETQRAALLRILSGLVFVLALVSQMPVVSLVPRWVCAYASSVLSRAEAAANSLVFVVACVLFGNRAAAVPMDRPPLVSEALPENSPSIDGLMRRIAALRAILNDLPRYARRLVKRYTREIVAVSIERPAMPAVLCLPRQTPTRARIERPPDIGIALSPKFGNR